MSFLSPLNKLPRKKLLWGFDIETYSDKNLFLMGSIVGDCDINKTFWSKEEFIAFLKKNSRNFFIKGYITATNLGFDAMALLEGTETFKDIRPLCKNSRMLSVVLPIVQEYQREQSAGVRNIERSRGSIKFIDTLNFAPFSVEKWGKLLGIPKLKKPDFLGEKPKTFTEKKILEAYNKQDSFITYKAIRFLQEGYNMLGGEMKLTAASTSMDIFKRKFLKETFYHPPAPLLSYIHEGYYGGRTETIIRGRIYDKEYYDINSMYPFTMKKEYPHPNFFKYANSVSLQTLQENEGMVKVKLIAPKVHIPYLPYRREDKDGKNLWHF